MHGCRFVLGGLVALLVLLPSARVLAQASAGDKASAEALFDAALRGMKEGKYAEACPKLENSQRIDPGVGTLLYLGECYEKLGRTASAWATFREAASQAEAGGQQRRAKAARDRIAKLESQLSYLTIEVADATRSLPGLRVRRDGTDAGTSIIGSPVPQDPGPVKIEVTAPDHESFSLTVTVQPKARQSVLIPPLAAIEGGPRPAETPSPGVAPAPAPTSTFAPAEATPASPAPAEESSPGSAQRVIGLVVAGVGVVGLGVGSYFGLSAIGHDKKADRGCTPTLCQEQAPFDHADAARDDAVMANIGFAAGGGLLAVGTVVYLLAPSKPSGVSLTPLVAPGFAGVSLGGRL
jgi:hypothetical protein